MPPARQRRQSGRTSFISVIPPLSDTDDSSSESEAPRHHKAEAEQYGESDNAQSSEDASSEDELFPDPSRELFEKRDADDNAVATVMYLSKSCLHYKRLKRAIVEHGGKLTRDPAQAEVALVDMRADDYYKTIQRLADVTDCRILDWYWIDDCIKAGRLFKKARYRPVRKYFSNRRDTREKWDDGMEDRRLARFLAKIRREAQEFNVRPGFHGPKVFQEYAARTGRRTWQSYHNRYKRHTRVYEALIEDIEAKHARRHGHSETIPQGAESEPVATHDSNNGSVTSDQGLQRISERQAASQQPDSTHIRLPQREKRRHRMLAASDGEEHEDPMTTQPQPSAVALGKRRAITPALEVRPHHSPPRNRHDASTTNDIQSHHLNNLTDDVDQPINQPGVAILADQLYTQMHDSTNLTTSQSADLAFCCQSLSLARDFARAIFQRLDDRVDTVSTRIETYLQLHPQVWSPEEDLVVMRRIGESGDRQFLKQCKGEVGVELKSRRMFLKEFDADMIGQLRYPFDLLED